MGEKPQNIKHRHISLGVLAHVDAGKTTLSEGQGIGGRDHKYIDQHMETTEIFLVIFNQFPPPHLSSLLLSYNR